MGRHAVLLCAAALLAGGACSTPTDPGPGAQTGAAAAAVLSETEASLIARWRADVMS